MKIKPYHDSYSSFFNVSLCLYLPFGLEISSGFQNLSVNERIDELKKIVKPLEEMCNATDLSRVQNITMKYAEFLYVTDTRVLVKSCNLLSFIRCILIFAFLLNPITSYHSYDVS